MPRGTSWAERIYRSLLRCYPGEFRDEYQQEMLQAFRDRLAHDRAGGRRPLLRLWGQVLADSVLRAPGEHLDVLRQDLRYALRSLRRTPLFALTTITTLALAVGATTAIFSVVYAVALRPLPYDPGDRLVRIWEDNQSLSITGFSVSVPNFVSWKERSRTLDLGAWMGESVTLQGAGDPVRVPSIVATASFFTLFRVQPLHGRIFDESDERLDAPPVALISAGLWKSHFGTEPATIGRAVTIAGTTHTIVGILPEGALPVDVEFFRPLRVDMAKEDRTDHLAQVVGGLRPGESLASAREELVAVARQLEREFPDSNKGWSVTLSSVYDWIVPDTVRRALYIVLAAVCCVLLIACANIAGLMLARAAGRRRELAVRMAIGAARRRLVRQVLTEGLLLTMIGGGAGVLLAYWALPALRLILPDTLPRGDDAEVNRAVLLFSLSLCVLTGVVFSALPALAGSRAQLVDSIRDGSRGSAVTTTRWRQTLAAAQVALATILLIAAGLLTESVRALQQVDLGFDPEHLTTAMIGLPSDRYEGPDANWGFYNRLLERLQASPGLTGAALTSGAPFDGGNTGQPIEAVGPSRLNGQSLQASWRMVSPGYFSTLRVPLIAGQLFTGNTKADDRSMIVSAAMARRIWGTDDPIGRQVAVNPVGTFTIVGVVGDVRLLDLALDPEPTMYISTARFTWPTMSVVVRGAAAGVEAAPLIRAAVRDIDPQLAIFNVQRTAERVGRSAAQPRLNAGLITMFALVAALLAALGIYGVLAFIVSQSRQEIGIRLALGAARTTVVALFLRRAVRLSVAGVLTGLIGAYAAGSALESLVFGVSAHDPLIFAAAAVLVSLVVLAAALIPASRAAAVSPLTALRD
jgi:predicted permease